LYGFGHVFRPGIRQWRRDIETVLPDNTASVAFAGEYKVSRHPGLGVPARPRQLLLEIDEASTQQPIRGGGRGIRHHAFSRLG